MDYLHIYLFDFQIFYYIAVVFVVTKIMNCKVRCLFLIALLQASLGFSQSWNSATVCKSDFQRSLGEQVSLNPLANDISALPLSIKSVSYTENGTVTYSTNKINFTPDKGFEGIAKVIYTSCDENGNCGVGEVSFLVVNPSKDFYKDTIYQGVLENSSIPFFVKEKDFVLQAPLQNGSLIKSGDFQYIYTPNQTNTGKEIISFSSGSKNQTIIIDIIQSAQNTRFLFEDIIYLNKNTSRLFDVKANDKPGLLITNFTQPPIGNLSLNGDNTFTFTSTLDFEGITSFEYTACAQGDCETSTVYLYVSDFLPREDLNPVFRTPEGKSLILPYEIPIADYEFKIIAEPTYGTIDFYKGYSTINSSCDQSTTFNPLVYTPLPGFVGTDQFIVNFCLTSGTRQCAPLKIKVESYIDPLCTPGSDLVWPGDANNDGIVNLKDVNTISEFLGTIGNPRNSASSNWTNQKSTNWNRNIDLNAKYADTDGDGDVDQTDLSAVILNFNQSHKLLPQGIYQLIPSGLEVSPVAAVIAPGEDAVIQFGFGSSTNLLKNIESISFDLEFNNQIISAEDLEVEIIENSWFGYNNAILPGRINGPGKLSINFASALGKSKNGQGKTVKVKAKGGPIVSHAEGFKIPKELPLEFSIKNIQLGQSNGNVLGFADTKTKVMIDFGKKAKSLDILPFPNPATQYFNIKANQDNELIERISVIDLTGRVVINKNLIPLKVYKQEVSGLHQGVYFIQIKTNEGVYTEKLEVIH